MPRLVALILALAVLVPVLRADVAPEPLRQGDSLQVPQGGQACVEMAAEEVTLTLSPHELRVEAVFHMLNTGREDVKLQVGFPMGYYKDAMKDFRIVRDGVSPDLSIVDRAAPDAPEEGGRGKGRVPGFKPRRDYWVVWDAVYPAGKTVTETVRYRVPTEGQAGYILHTGAGWAGKIGKAVVTVNLADGLTRGHLRELGPGGFRLADAGASWTFEQLEPTPQQDISIRYDSRETLDQEIARATASRDPMVQESLLRTLREGAPVHGMDGGVYWGAVGRLLDAMLPPEGLPKDQALVYPVWSHQENMVRHGALTFADLLHEAVDRAGKEAGARKALPRLRGMLAAWREGRVRTDLRELKKRNAVISFPPRPDIEAVQLGQGVDPKRLQADLEAAERILAAP